MSQISEFRILYIKDIQTLCQCSESTAKRLKLDVQKEFKIENKPVLFKHFQKYFNLP